MTKVLTNHIPPTRGRCRVRRVQQATSQGRRREWADMIEERIHVGFSRGGEPSEFRDERVDVGFLCVEAAHPADLVAGGVPVVEVELLS